MPLRSVDARFMDRSLARVATPAPSVTRVTVFAALAAASALLATACTTEFAPREHNVPAPVVDRAAASAAVLNEYMLLMQRLVQGAPAEQAEIAVTAQKDYETAPTPSRQLKFALVLATPGHPATDQPRAQRLLRELMANPEMLLSGERALAFVELQQIDDILTVKAENTKLQSDAVRADREKLTSANRRLQTEMDENTRLRKELEEARAKLDAIANIERSLNERKPSNEGRPQ
jgi:hypothetical protein